MSVLLYGDCPVQWTEVQTKSLKHDYPLVQSDDSSIQDSIVRTYLEYLWLPETLMSLRFFIPCLQRLLHAASVASSTPTSELIDPILLTVRSCASKYGHDIPEIIGQEESGEEPELEESMIWYAFNHEKAPEAGEGSNGVVDQDTWRKKWLDRMEKRETQIQILLYMMKIAMSPTSDAQSLPPSPRKRRGVEAARDVPSPESRLESFFDKLSMWQIMDTASKSSEDELHWTQRFCEDIVELCFSSSLPEQCSLLRSKVFPYSPFSDGTDTGEERSPSPQLITIDDETPTRQPSRHTSRSSSRRSSLASGQTIQAPERSLSRALAEDRELRRSVSIGASSKRAFSREVSMSRSLREARRLPEPVVPVEKPVEAVKKSESKKDGTTLVESTPVKPIKTRTDLPTAKGGGSGMTSSSGDVFVQSTPTKPRTKSRR